MCAVAPKPNLAAGLKNRFEVERELFDKDSFKTALHRTFVSAGQAPGKDGKFAVYKSHARNSIAANLLPEGAAEDHQGSLATVAGDVDVEIYQEDDDPETDAEEEADEEADE